MELTVTGNGIGLAEDQIAPRVERLRSLFPSEPDVSVRFDADGDKIVAEVTVPVRGYRTIRSKGKGEDAPTALDKAVRRLELKYKLFWTRGSFRLGDCC